MSPLESEDALRYIEVKRVLRNYDSCCGVTDGRTRKEAYREIFEEEV